MNASAWQMLLEGAWTTVWISAVSIAIGVVAGLVIALIRLARIPIVDQLLVLYISVARATPLVTLALFIFLSAPDLGLDLNRSVAGILALTLNTTAFNAEIWRSAFRNFSRDQREAAMATGMTPWITFRRIMLPQMVITSLPGLVNEMSFLIKGSPAIAVIGIVDLTRVTNRISAVTYEPLPPILVAGALYMMVIGCLVWLQRIFERRANRLAM
ncbi:MULTISPECIES: amino acid ABC transporter permease [Chromohalobacter]|jgi:polar amino acid transport system permease protein|uniref:Amino acid ABC transporter membrane protein 1, PAAT family n=1 Tax=Chromohalobacter israelensis (strain ATCC BAA-138 / DSM 3043 / CIP 106854 / NCIMB 13768 / 1H11) TaxID=290398 RepID=Q1R189_CHRI1|nr:MULTISPECIES: amino acid ABC transporter permease [Chromohalobacter]ABE57519.1 amino acid ABC transporter membrane protein 1, PAAT family [Chromohalobacter salexigens DSM 3043]MDO0945344.1 amino acid ABC transporter permease [Chromohalobacter salexigens]NQY45449.1 amino acid ABC transporter permease [Chromohalobacter sp.]NWO55455.1 amino acid ABC transporter permease [Chromohalobacter salexigens]PWW42869.1 amino acid ABC transporter membrane protein 1 (PAAT family) [Chromohalobacter salexig